MVQRSTEYTEGYVARVEKRVSTSLQAAHSYTYAMARINTWRVQFNSRLGVALAEALEQQDYAANQSLIERRMRGVE